MAVPPVLLIAPSVPFWKALERELVQLGRHVIAVDTLALGVHQALAHSPKLIVVSVQRDENLDRLVAMLDQFNGGERPLLVGLPESQTAASAFTTSDSTKQGNRPASSMLERARQLARALFDILAVYQSSCVRSTRLVSCDGLRLDKARYEATLDNKPITLTLTEFNILWTLAYEPQRARTRQELVEASRGVNANIKKRTIDAHIKTLRRKLADHADLVETVRGVGYRFRLAACDRGAS